MIFQYIADAILFMLSVIIRILVLPIHLVHALNEMIFHGKSDK